MKQHFCTYKQSEALKELGFDEECLAFYDAYNGGTYLFFESRRRYRFPFNIFNKQLTLKDYSNSNIECFEGGNCILAPLKSQAFEFFRDKYNFYHNISTGCDYINLCYIFEYSKEYLLGNYPSYEEAENACINKLIEIAKNK